MSNILKFPEIAQRKLLNFQKVFSFFEGRIINPRGLEDIGNPTDSRFRKVEKYQKK